MNFAGDPAALRRRAGWAFVCGLCLAALVAITALLSGSFDQTDLRVVGTSLGFSVFSSTGGAGGALRRRPDTWAWAIGTLSVVTAALAFALLLLALWPDDGSDSAWRAFGVVALVALWSGHASLVLDALRPGDSALVRALSGAGIVALGIDASVGVLALVGALEGRDVRDGAQGLAAVLVVALLSSALPPVLRRIQPAAPRPRRVELADGVAEVADNLSSMPLPPQARAEVARLRELVAVSRRCRT